jgi:DNA polymerase III epsilon subunit-like protein
MSWKEQFLVIDTETTGLKATDRVLEVGMALYRNLVLSAVDTTLINPGEIEFTPDVVEALTVNGLSILDLEKAPEFGSVAEKLLEWLGGSKVWVGHNVQFDVGKLVHEFRLINASPPQGVVCIDTLLCDLALNPGGHKRTLSEVEKRWEVPGRGNHRAQDDAVATGEILVRMARVLPDSTECMKVLMRRWEIKWAEILARRDTRSNKTNGQPNQ